MVKLDEKEILFMKGVECFNNKEFYDAHEFWEDLWSDYPLKDALFIQGLIQVSVAFFHITNLNLTGSRSLFNKSIPKLKKFPFNHRNFNVHDFIDSIEKSRNKVCSIDKTKDFDWNLAPKIILK